MLHLSSVHDRLRSSPLAQRLTLVARTLLLVGFVSPGLTKVAGREFAPGIDAATAAGAFFYALYGTGAYYTFVGVAQVAAGLLLASRRTALLGAVLFAPVIANIVVFVVATDFGIGTVITTVLMSAACLWLLVWDAHRLVPVVARGAAVPVREVEPVLWDATGAPGGAFRVASRGAFVLGTLGAVAFTLAARGLVPEMGLLLGGYAVMGAGLVTVGVWVAAAVRGRTRATAAGGGASTRRGESLAPARDVMAPPS